MTSDTLQFPTTWEERRPHLEGNVLFVPDYYQGHEHFAFPCFSTLFGNEAPVKIEFCSGNGSWIFQKAQDEPANFIAVEKRFDRVKKIWKRGKELPNLFTVCGEAYTFAKHYVLSASVDEVYINFPDPWPKDRHAKHRLMTPLFLDELARILKRGGEVVFVTDDAPYSEVTIALFEEHKAFRSYYQDPSYTTHFSDYGASYFSALWQELGRTIRVHRFVKH